jgi:hypothetical protein
VVLRDLLGTAYKFVIRETSPPSSAPKRRWQNPDSPVTLIDLWTNDGGSLMRCSAAE